MWTVRRRDTDPAKPPQFSFTKQQRQVSVFYVYVRKASRAQHPPTVDQPVPLCLQHETARPVAAVQHITTASNIRCFLGEYYRDPSSLDNHGLIFHTRDS